jgi:hypothetical protein
MPSIRNLSVFVAVALIAVASCQRRSGYSNLMSSDVCNADRGGFTLDIDNPFFPLPVGHQIVLEGKGRDASILVRVTVLDEIEKVGGVDNRVVEEYEAEDGNVVEIARNYFVQSSKGTVCYFGEVVDNYGRDGKIKSHSGSWRADKGKNRPGIFMPAKPKLNQAFQQEIAPGVAEDQSKVVRIGESIDTPAGTFRDTITFNDRNPMDGTEDKKVYARGVGLIWDEAARLTKFSPSPS